MTCRFSVIAVSLLLASQAAAQTKPNFTGSWLLDVEASSFSEGGKPRPHTVTVKQTETELSFEDSRDHVTRVVRLDGEEVVRESLGVAVKSSARWKGDKLFITFDFGAGYTFTTWSTIPDGKTLTAEVHFLRGSALAERKTEEVRGTLVYRRQ